MDLHPGEQVIYDGHPSWRSVMSLYAARVLVAASCSARSSGSPPHTRLGGSSSSSRASRSRSLVGLVRRIFVRFTITDQRLRIQRGIISRAVQQTRIDRVQNVNTRQSPVDRLLRVGAVDFDTAGGDDSDFIFDGVNDPAEVSPPSTRPSARRPRPQRDEGGEPRVGGV